MAYSTRFAPWGNNMVPHGDNMVPSQTVTNSHEISFDLDLHFERCPLLLCRWLLVSIFVVTVLLTEEVVLAKRTGETPRDDEASNARGFVLVLAVRGVFPIIAH